MQLELIIIVDNNNEVLIVNIQLWIALDILQIASRFPRSRVIQNETLTLHLVFWFW